MNKNIMSENVYFLCHLTSLFLKIASSDVDVTQHCNKRGIDAATCLFVNEQKSVNIEHVCSGDWHILGDIKAQGDFDVQVTCMHGSD